MTAWVAQGGSQQNTAPCSLATPVAYAPAPLELVAGPMWSDLAAPAQTSCAAQARRSHARWRVRARAQGQPASAAGQARGL